jgi:hypothetical protein
VCQPYAPASKMVKCFVRPLLRRRTLIVGSRSVMCGQCECDGRLLPGRGAGGGLLGGWCLSIHSRPAHPEVPSKIANRTNAAKVRPERNNRIYVVSDSLVSGSVMSRFSWVQTVLDERVLIQTMPAFSD